MKKLKSAPHATRIIAIGLALAGLSASFIAAPADADSAHPDIFTFEAHRTSTDVVAYSGQFAIWNDRAGAYVAGDDGVSIESAVPGSGVWSELTGVATDSTGHFVGYEHVRPTRSLRAATYETDPPAAVSNAAQVESYGPLVSEYAMLQAVQPKKNGKVEVSGQFGGWAAWEAQSADEVSAGPDGGQTEYATPVAHLDVQWKIKGKWKSVKKVTLRDGDFSFKISKPKSAVWRVVQSSDSAYTPLISEVFRSTKKKFVGN